MSFESSLNLEEIMGEEDRLNNKGSGSNNFLDQFVPMPEVKAGQTGAVYVRVLPPVKGGALFQYNRTHKINGRSVHCPRPLINGKYDYKTPCPICDYYNALWKQIDKASKEYGEESTEVESLKDEARELKPVERFYYNAIVRSAVINGKDEKNVGPRILSIGKSLHAKIIRAIVGSPDDPESQLGNIADLKGGYDLIIRKTVTAGKDAYPKYDDTSFAKNPSPAGTIEEIKRWAENLHDLSKLRSPRDSEYLEKELAIHRGLISDEDETFNTDSFDAKWTKKTPNESEPVSTPKPQSKPVSESSYEEEVQQPVAKPAPKAKAKPSEDIAIADDEFLRQLQEMEGWLILGV